MQSVAFKIKSDFKKAFEIFKKIGVKGCNISMPFKKQAWEIVRKPTYLRNVKSVNTIVLKSNNYMDIQQILCSKGLLN